MTKGIEVCWCHRGRRRIRGSDELEGECFHMTIEGSIEGYQNFCL